jgi:hypothetical protein
MTDDDLIRRGDALKAVSDRWAAHMEQAQRTQEYDSAIAARDAEKLTHFAREADAVRHAIAALPATPVDALVKALEAEIDARQEYEVSHMERGWSEYSRHERALVSWMNARNVLIAALAAYHGEKK